MEHLGTLKTNKRCLWLTLQNKSGKINIFPYGLSSPVYYCELAMDRLELLSKASGRDILTSIKNYKAAQEG